MVRRLLPCVAIAAMALLAVGSAASAHIDPDPKEAQAGSRLTVGFTVEHGCEGSPTVRLDMRLPDGVVDPVAEPVDGWTGSVDTTTDTTTDGTIVSFVGGPLADDVEGTFGVTMTLPPTPDTTIHFPFVQRCEVGEIRWIGIPAEPGDDLDEPAPAMILTGPVATTVPPTTTTPTTTIAAGPATTSPQSTMPDSAPTTQPTATTDAASDTTTPDTIEPVATTAGDGGGSNTGTIAFVLSVAAVLALGTTVAYRSRQSRAAYAASAPGADTGAAPGDAG